MERVPQKQIAALEAEVRALKVRIDSMITYTELARTNATGANDFAKEAGNPKDRQRPIRRASPWGLSGRPVVDGVLSVIVKALGGVFNGFSVGITSEKYGPQDLQEGETCLWNSVDGTRILLDKDGNVVLTAAAGKKVNINGASFALPQWDSFATQMNTFTGAIKALAAATDPATVILLANGIRTAAIALDTAMNANSNYKSTNATNG